MGTSASGLLHCIAAEPTWVLCRQNFTGAVPTTQREYDQ